MTELITTELVTRLTRGSWPGNVRQLRNYLAQCISLLGPPPLVPATAGPASPISVDPTRGFTEAKQIVIECFERDYLRALIQRHSDNVSKAARAAGMNRAHLHRLLSRYGIR